MAHAAHGIFLLRIEDIDQSRARPAWEAQIFDDLQWLGLRWPRPVFRQSHRASAYRGAMAKLWDLGLIYPCTCSRRDILDAQSAPQEGAQPAHGPDGPIYPGTCRPKGGRSALPPPPNSALRLDMARAMALVGDDLEFHEQGAGPAGQSGRISLSPAQMVEQVGDVVLARRDMGSSYHLSVVVDDAMQGISHVVRGADLFEATQIHVLLQRLMRLPTPIYHHHRLIRDDTGKRLAKRDDARAISLLRAEGASPQDIRAMVGL